MNKKATQVPMGNLYFFNKQAMLKDTPMSKEKIEEIKKDLEEWFNWQLDSYAMLLCRERYDFTLFSLYRNQNKNPAAVASNELIECLNNRGKILSIEKEAANKWEIWVKIKEEAFVFYLFNCDDFVIEC